MPLDEAFIEQLLKNELAGRNRPTALKPPQTVSRFLVPVQHGPLRWHDTADRCASRGCGSETYCKVSGIPRCTMHALQELNEMLVEKEMDILL